MKDIKDFDNVIFDSLTICDYTDEKTFQADMEKYKKEDMKKLRRSVIIGFVLTFFLIFCFLFSTYTVSFTFSFTSLFVFIIVGLVGALLCAIAYLSSCPSKSKELQKEHDAIEDLKKVLLHPEKIKQMEVGKCSVFIHDISVDENGYVTEREKIYHPKSSIQYNTQISKPRLELYNNEVVYTVPYDISTKAQESKNDVV